MQQCLRPSTGKIHKNKGQNWAQNKVLCHFLKLGSLVFLEIPYNDSLQQFLTSSKGRIHKKKNVWGQDLSQNKQKLGLKLQIFAKTIGNIPQVKKKL